jgi:hypothetical protein
MVSARNVVDVGYDSGRFFIGVEIAILRMLRKGRMSRDGGGGRREEVVDVERERDRREAD